jgi:ATP-dependent helicase HrpB
MTTTPDLPVVQLRPRLRTTANRLILTAPTGSGKSTQIPQFLLDDGVCPVGQIVVLQPRRLPARLLAKWVAEQRGGRLGDEVGYQIRLDDVTSPRTRIRYVTEGILLRQMIADPRLRDIAAIVFDEFHERHLYGDITLARALQIQQTCRPDLRLIVMSATLDVAPLQTYLAPCDVLSSAGRAFPVTIEYLPKPPGDVPLWDIAAAQLDRSWDGDALVFMPGGYEIQRTVQAIRARHGSRFLVFPLHGDLPPAEQDAAVARYDRPKVVVATNVAETSLTIDGVRLVIDSGLARLARYDPHRGINTLLIEKISRASADQRAGRAGRTAAGHCIRLWTQRDHDSRPAQELPEIKRLDLAEVVLTLKAAGVRDVKSFRWLEPPDPKSLDRAEQLLADLGALDPTGQITPIGQRMLAFPLHPRYSRMLLAAHERGCVRPVAFIAALTQGRDILIRNPGKPVLDARAELFGGEHDSDFFILMRACRYAQRCGFDVERCRRVGIHAQNARQVYPLFEQFLAIAEREGLEVGERPVANEAIQQCVLTGFADQLARRVDAGTLRCELVHRRRGLLARDSVVAAPLFVAAEIAEVQGRDLNVMLSLATAVREEWLRELFPGDVRETRQAVFDPAQRRVFTETARQFRDLVLEVKRSDDVSSEEAARLLAAHCELPGWNEAVEQWITRVNCLADWMPELNLPRITGADRQTLREQVCHGATSFKEIKDRPVLPVVKSWLSAAQQAWVEQYAPERIELPGGRRAKITYAPDKPPAVAARIQDLYGVTEGLFIAQRRVALTIEILAPNQRPVQVTSNLANFWRDQYPRLKQELQRKYPKHEWR